MKKRFFTLAEVLSVVVILGVIASITIPTTIKRGSERANKTKIRKALSVYNTAVEKMLIENNLPRSAAGLNNFIGANCQNATNYFRIAQLETPNNNCRFKAPDGLWWDITDLTNTIVAFEDKQDRQNPAKNLNWVTAGGAENKAFKFVTRFDNNGSARINDNGFTTFSYRNSGDRQTFDIAYTEAIKKVNAYFNNEEYIENFIAKFSKPCFDHIISNRCSGGGACTGCTTIWNRGDRYATGDYWGQWVMHVYDDKGKEIAYQWNCNPGTTYCLQNATNGVYIPIEKNLEVSGYECDNSFHICAQRFLRKTNNDGTQCTCQGCEGVTAGGAKTYSWQAGSYKDENGVEQKVPADSCKAKNSCAKCSGNCPQRDATDHCYHL